MNNISLKGITFRVIQLISLKTLSYMTRFVNFVLLWVGKGMIWSNVTSAVLGTTAHALVYQVFTSRIPTFLSFVVSLQVIILTACEFLNMTY